jgi:hypothetical protein
LAAVALIAQFHAQYLSQGADDAQLGLQAAKVRHVMALADSSRREQHFAAALSLFDALPAESRRRESYARVRAAILKDRSG